MTPSSQPQSRCVTRPPVEKRWIPCTLCGSKDHEPLYDDELGDATPSVDYDFNPDTRKTYAIVRCRGCGLIFTNPMPDFAGVYEDVKDEQYLASQEQRRRTARRAVREIRKFASSGRLLDVGCATGIFLDEAGRYFDVQGLELSRWASARTADRHDVFTKPLAEMDPRARYDVITLFGVIEHFEDPSRQIEEISRRLRPGGLLVVYTGNVDGWLPRLLGKRWWWYQGMHLFFFSRKTCTALLEKHGLKVLHRRKQVVYFQLFSLAVSLRRYRIGKLLYPLLTRKPISEIMIPLSLSGEMLLFARKKS